MQKCNNRLTVSQGCHFIVAPVENLRQGSQNFPQKSSFLFLPGLIVCVFPSFADSRVTGNGGRRNTRSSRCGMISYNQPPTAGCQDWTRCESHLENEATDVQIDPKSGQEHEAEEAGAGCGGKKLVPDLGEQGPSSTSASSADCWAPYLGWRLRGSVRRHEWSK